MMRKFELVFIFILCLCGCTSKINKTEQSRLKFIDYSYCNGWNQTYSIRIDSLGNSILYFKKRGNSDLYYSFKLLIKEQDSVSLLSSEINHSKLDTMHDAVCTDCSYFYAVIKYDNKVNKIFVRNLKDSIPSDINELSEYIQRIIALKITMLESIKFESRIKSFEEPPVPEPVDFKKGEISKTVK